MTVDVPQRQYDLRITDHYAPVIRDAITRMWPETALRAAAAAQNTDSLPTPDLAPLQGALEALWADAWATGRHGAQLQLGAVRKGGGGGGRGADEAGPPPRPLTSGPDVSINWSTWEPGNLEAAILTADGGFAKILQDAKVTLDGIASTTVTRLGTVLSEGLLNGDNIDTIARQMARYLAGDLDRAELIAHTETARAQTLASLRQYADMGVRQWEWLTTTGACPRCVDAEARNPHDLGEPAPPGHPRCRCASAPVWQSITE